MGKIFGVGLPFLISLKIPPNWQKLEASRNLLRYLPRLSLHDKSFKKPLRNAAEKNFYKSFGRVMYLCCRLTTPLKRAVTNLFSNKYMLTKIKQLAKM